LRQSIRIRANDFTASLGSEAPPGLAGDRILHEPNAAVGEESVDAAGVEASGGQRVAPVVTLARIPLASADVHWVLMIVRRLSDVEGRPLGERCPAPPAVAGDEH